MMRMGKVEEKKRGRMGWKVVRIEGNVNAEESWFRFDSFGRPAAAKGGGRLVNENSDAASKGILSFFCTTRSMVSSLVARKWRRSRLHNLLLRRYCLFQHVVLSP